MKVVFVVIDTLRADHLGCYGYRRPTSPRLDALARESVLFERTYASDVPTQPSYTAIFTGQRGIRTGVVSHSTAEDLPDSTPYLSEIMAQNGHETAGVSTLFFMKKYFARGFHTYMNPVAHERHRIQQVTAAEINRHAVPWLRAHAERDFFLFLHYWDPHSIYRAPEARYRRMFYRRGDPTDPKNKSLAALDKQLVGPFVRGHLDAVREGLTDAEYMIAQYDGEIRYVDTRFGEVLDLLDELGIADDTLLIVTSDHGESMTEHEHFFDHVSVYEQVVRVPLLVRWPRRLAGGRRVGALVQNIDLAPTILEAARIEKPQALQGRSLLPLCRGETEMGYPFVVSNQGLWQAKRMLSDGRWKVIRAIDNGFWPAPALELYDLDEDPGEMRNLAEQMPAQAAELELRLRRWEDAQLRGGVDPLLRIAQAGLPSRPGVEHAAKRRGLDLSYEEYRNLIDVPYKT